MSVHLLSARDGELWQAGSCLQPGIIPIRQRTLAGRSPVCTKENAGHGGGLVFHVTAFLTRIVQALSLSVMSGRLEGTTGIASPGTAGFKQPKTGRNFLTINNLWK
jgi:hypothetical protein